MKTLNVFCYDNLIMTSTTLDALVTFKEQFLTVDFDMLLIDQNYINSDKYYLQYKNNYLSTTNTNLQRLTELLSTFEPLDNNYIITGSKYVYNYIDTNEHLILNTEIKSLMTSQKEAFDNFTNYISFLNTNSSYNSNWVVQEKQGNISRMTKLSKK